MLLSLIKPFHWLHFVLYCCILSEVNVNGRRSLKFPLMNHENLVQHEESQINSLGPMILMILLCSFKSEFGSWYHHPHISTDIPDPLSPPLPIVHCFQQVFKSTFRISTELLYVGSSWLSCLCSSMWSGSQDYITYKLVPTSPTVFPCLVCLPLIIFLMGGR